MTKTLYQAWHGLNMEFLTDPDDDPRYSNSPHRARRLWTIEATGFGLPGTVPPYISTTGDPRKRTKLLWGRYVQDELWEAGIEALKKTAPQLDGRKRSLPAATTLYLQRRATKASKVPTGGGCLISLVFWRFRGEKGVQVYARASEVTKALLSDLYFLHELVRRAIEDAGFESWDLEELTITWHSVYGSQKDNLVPVFLLFHEGEDAVVEFMTGEAKSRWQYAIQRYFWRFILYPERINWSPRRRRAQAFLNHAQYDWYEIGETSGKLAEFPDTGKGG